MKGAEKDARVMGKLFYSIGELCDALNEAPHHVRDALVAAGVPMIHGGQAADLSKWWSGVVEQPNGDIVIFDGNHCVSPSPDDVMVLTERLPESWKRLLDVPSEQHESRSGNETRAEQQVKARAALDRYKGNKTHAAKELGISTKQLRRRLGVDGTVKKSVSSEGPAHNPFNISRPQKG